MSVTNMSAPKLERDSWIARGEGEREKGQGTNGGRERGRGRGRGEGGRVERGKGDKYEWRNEGGALFEGEVDYPGGEE